MGGVLLKADDVWIGSVLEVCNALNNYNTHLIELSDGIVMPLSVAKGEHKERSAYQPASFLEEKEAFFQQVA